MSTECSGNWNSKEMSISFLKCTLLWTYRVHVYYCTIFIFHVIEKHTQWYSAKNKINKSVFLSSECTTRALNGKTEEGIEWKEKTFLREKKSLLTSLQEVKSNSADAQPYDDSVAIKIQETTFFRAENHILLSSENESYTLWLPQSLSPEVFHPTFFSDSALKKPRAS